MDFGNKALKALAIIFFVIAAYVIYNYAIQNIGEHESASEKLYLKSRAIGKGAENYLYSYEENLGEYVKKTTLIQSGSKKLVKIETLFSEREIYLLENDTILCVLFDGNEVCSSIKNDTTMTAFISGLAAQFFNDEKIDKALKIEGELIKKKAITFVEAPKKKEFDGKECEDIKFTIDYSNLTLDDLIKFNINQNSPKRIDGEVCYDEKENEVYEKSYSYKYNGADMKTEFKFIASDWKYKDEINLSKNLTTGAVDLLIEAIKKQDEFNKCLGKPGVEKDKCVFAMAVTKNYEKICEYAGTKADYCVVNFAANNKDAKRCDAVQNTKIKDDCYIEVAVSKGDVAPCSLLNDKTRKAECITAVTVKASKNETTATALPQINETQGNEKNLTPSNMTQEEKDALNKIFNEIG